MLDGAFASEGQLLFTPSQDSATSQSPAEALHTAVDFASEGHDAVDPVHVSAMSHIPEDDLQIVEEDLNWHVLLLQQASNGDSHCSPDSNIPFPQTDEVVPVH